MPEMDGYGHEGDPSGTALQALPIVALTAKAMKVTGQCIEAGASDIFTKPVDLDQFVFSA